MKKKEIALQVTQNVTTILHKIPNHNGMVPMTDVDLEAIERRANAATPGPWKLDGLGEVYHDGMGCTPDGCPGHPQNYGTWVKGPLLDEYGDSYEGDKYEQSCRDAEFVTHAREDIPALLSLIRHQSSLIASMRKALDKAEWCMTGYNSDDDDIRWCPLCTRKQSDDHTPDCPIAAVKEMGK